MNTTCKGRSAFFAGVACVLLAAGDALAEAPLGVAVTRSGRHEGPVELKEGKVRAGGREIALDEILLLGLNPTRRTLPPPNTLRLREGEIWRGRILGLSRAGIEFSSIMFGRHRVPVALVDTIEFTANAPADPSAPPGSLFRAKGEPIPGQLLWVNEQQIALDTKGPLGVFTLSREAAAGYRFAPPPDPPTPRDPAAGDEVTLIDGNILRGSLTAKGATFRLTHALFGKLTLRPEGVRSIVRRANDVVYLRDLSPASSSLKPLVTEGAAEAARKVLPGGTSAPKTGFTESLWIAPGGVVVYRPALGREAQFAAIAAPPENARGTVRVRVSAGERAIAEARVSPGGEPVELAGTVRPGEDLTLAVEYAGPLRFPSGAVICDGYLILKRP
jgi:hypothetical protein